jgi:60 kDa SS-A/Ro ribonucleoprotein
MAKLNTAAVAVRYEGTTHEGAPAVAISPLQRLRRSVLSCMLWESEFYEDGAKIADRIVELCKDPSITPGQLASLAYEARNIMHLRHAPLLLLCGLIERGRGSFVVQNGIAMGIQRADELAELVAMYWRNGKRPLSAQMKKGLARAFLKFDAYQLGKYNRDGKVKLRDVLFLCHAKPESEARKELWKKLVDGTLESPDTWEVNLSAGGEKRETFERMIREDKLGYLALLRNVRGMVEAGVDEALLRQAIIARRGSARVLPFRYVAAARACPQMEPAIDKALQECVNTSQRLFGKTFVLVDVSGSMDTAMSGKSGLKRIDAAAALASVIRSEDLRVFTFSHDLREVPPRVGMAGIDAVIRSQPHGGTYLGGALTALNHLMSPADRLIVITDEQSADAVPDPKPRRAYMINVASAKNGVGYGPRWVHLDGFSEGVLRWIFDLEQAARD